VLMAMNVAFLYTVVVQNRAHDLGYEPSFLATWQTTTTRPQCQCHALYSKDHERHASYQRFSLLEFACERHKRTCTTISPCYERCRCCINFGGVQTPRPQIIPKVPWILANRRFGIPFFKGRGMFLICLERHEFVPWPGRVRDQVRCFWLSHSLRSMTLRAAPSIETLQSTNLQPTTMQQIYHAFCDKSSKTTTALPFTSGHDVSIAPKG
jgi:hypothetical protein